MMIEQNSPRSFRPAVDDAVAIPMNDMSQHAVMDLHRLKKKALFFVWVGEIWNLLEAAVALWSGIGAGSVALIGFGLDSILELAAGDEK